MVGCDMSECDCAKCRDASDLRPPRRRDRALVLAGHDRWTCAAPSDEEIDAEIAKVDALHGPSRDATRESSALVRAEALRELASATMNDALARQRAAFHARWGWFLKCRGCGARVEPILPPIQCACGSRVIITSGYSRTP
jgi:hypothetical protein